MQIGMVGLGRMGANMVRRLIKEQHNCVVYDRSTEAIEALVKVGAVGARLWFPDNTLQHGGVVLGFDEEHAGLLGRGLRLGARQSAERGHHHDHQ